MKKDILTGFLVGMIATFFGLFLYLEYFTGYGFDASVKMVTEGHLWGKVLGLAAIPNLFAFFIFLRKKQDYRARGVLMATFVIAVLVLIAQFF